jgi:hypothetical protein
VVRGSSLSDLVSPLTRSVTSIGSDGSCSVGVLVAGASARAVSGSIALPAAPAMKLRRLKPDVMGDSVVSGIDGLRRWRRSRAQLHSSPPQRWTPILVPDSAIRCSGSHPAHAQSLLTKQ